MTFADAFLGADHGIVFEDVQGEVNLGNGLLVGQSALQRLRTGASHDD